MLVEETLKPIASIFQHDIPEDEIAFLTMHFASLCSTFDEYTTVEDSAHLEKELYDYLSYQEEPVSTETDGPSLIEITTPSLIQLNVEAKNWEEAIRISAAPFLQLGRINRRYIDKMIEIAKKEGAYMVISKHVALPHARPIDGVEKLVC